MCSILQFRCSHMCFNMHFVLPSYACFILVESHILPIYWKGWTELSITNSWNLEWEESLVLLHIAVFVLLHCLCISSLIIDIKKIVVTQELSVETTNDHDFRWRHLAHTSSLSGWDGCFHSCQVHFLPLIAEIGEWELDSFNWGGVLLVWVLDTTENVNPWVIEIGSWMIMTSFIDFV